MFKARRQQKVRAIISCEEKVPRSNDWTILQIHSYWQWMRIILTPITFLYSVWGHFRQLISAFLVWTRYDGWNKINPRSLFYYILGITNVLLNHFWEHIFIMVTMRWPYFDFQKSKHLAQFWNTLISLTKEDFCSWRIKGFLLIN